MTVKIENARITGSRWYRHGGLTHSIMLEGDGWGIGFGGYSLRDEAVYLWIKEIMNVLELEEFSESDLIGMVVRLKTEGWGGRCLAIGHPIKDKWFEPAVFFEEHMKTKENNE